MIDDRKFTITTVLAKLHGGKIYQILSIIISTFTPNKAGAVFVKFLTIIARIVNLGVHKVNSLT